MGIKDLSLDEIKSRSRNFRKILDKYEINYEAVSEADKFLEDNPLAPIISTICDQEILAENAGFFPYWLNKRLKSQRFSAQELNNLGKNQIKNLLRTYMDEDDKWPSYEGFNREKYLENISSYIKNACDHIVKIYKNNPDNMFIKGKYSVPEMYFILRSLPGFGQKKASMIVRDFIEGNTPWYKGIVKRLEKQGVEFFIEGKHLSAVPIDVHVVKVFFRLFWGSSRIPAQKDFMNFLPDIQNFAKMTLPEYPAKIDNILWRIGRGPCKQNPPKCNECILKEVPCGFALRQLNHN